VRLLSGADGEDLEGELWEERVSVTARREKRKTGTYSTHASKLGARERKRVSADHPKRVVGGLRPDLEARELRDWRCVNVGPNEG
jgi:hypothetical protein